jgi:hypothetical protein
VYAGFGLKLAANTPTDETVSACEKLAAVDQLEPSYEYCAVHWLPLRAIRKYVVGPDAMLEFTRIVAEPLLNVAPKTLRELPSL